MTGDPLDALRLPIVPIDPRPEFAAALLRRLEAREEPALGRGATVRYFVDDLDAAVRALRERGARFRNEIASGVAVRQVLLEDPAGNPIELFEPAAGYHERS